VRSLSVVIPVHNEEGILSSTVDHVVRGLRKLDLGFFEVILCENGSTDGTRALAARLRDAYSEVKLLTWRRADYGAAMKAGFLASRGDAIVNFDADYYDLDFVEEAMQTDGEIVVAAKGVLGSHDARELTRRIVSRCFGWMVRRLLAVRVTETHGMKLFHRRAISDLVPGVRSTKDLFDTELLARSEWLGLEIRELPIRTEELRHSRSGIVSRIPRTLWGLVRMRVRLNSLRSARVRSLPQVAPESGLDVAV
jgi:glycosyltransferase involved in cell wall biosynthesis